jgi:hypothetical protein
MSIWIKVARYHLVQPLLFVAIPWGILTFAFLVNLAIMGLVPVSNGEGRYVGALASIYIIICIAGALTTFRSLPFGLALGVSRRSYYIGTAVLAVATAVVYGLALTVLNVIEGSTGGWGVSIHFFRVPYLLDGPWYLTWLTSLVGLTLLFVYGTWYGLVYRRWNIVGLVAFIAAQITVLLAGALITTWADAWTSVARFFSGLTASGLTGLLAGLTAALLAGGLVTIRHATV